MGLLEDRVALVSGVGPGMGQAIARAMGREGAKVVLAARSAAYLDEVAASIDDALPVPTDITDADACQRLVDAGVERFGRIDVLVNAAFRPDPRKPFLRADLAEWRALFEVNVWGTMQLTRLVVPQMQAAGGGAIVFINSMVVRTGAERQGGYAMSKGALMVAARVLAHELGPHNIRVNSVVPGWMWGPPVEGYVGWQAQRREVDPQVVKDEIAARIPLRRIPTQEDCAEAVVFLASDRAAAITGQTLDTNGGEVFAP